MDTQPNTAPYPVAQPIVGIDIGKDGLHLSFPDDGQPPDKWQVIYLNYKDNPLWWQDFLHIIHPCAIVAAEPTGWMYLAPVANLIEQFTQAHLWLVNHYVTGNIRSYRISDQKTDYTDARALAIIAQDIAAGKPPRGARRHDPDHESAVLTLRLYVNNHVRLKKESVRLQNRIQAFGHAMFPALPISQTWFKLIELGAVTPQQIKNFQRTPSISGSGWRYIEELQQRLPNIEVDERIVKRIIEATAELAAVEEKLTETEREIFDIINHHPFREVTHRWLTVPLITPIYIAALHVATHGQISTFTEEQFRAAVGQFPQIKSSGKSTTGRSAKKGYRPAMNAIYMWTKSLLKEYNAPNPVHEYFAGGEKNGGRKFTAARAKLVKILFGVAKSPQGYTGTRPTRKSKSSKKES